MAEESGLRKLTVTVPEKHFLKWHKEESNIARSKLRYEFAKEALSHITLITIFLLTAIIYPVALIGIVPTLLHFVFKTMKKDKDDLR